MQLRKKIANKYFELLGDYYKCQFIPDEYESAWAQFSLLASNTEERTHCINNLNEHEIPTAIYYPIPLHLQKAFNKLNYNKGDFPITEDISSRIFSIPMHPYLTGGDINKICELLISCKESNKC